MIWAILVLGCIIRIALMWHPIKYSGADETSVRRGAFIFSWRGLAQTGRAYARNPQAWAQPGPMRFLSLAFLSLFIGPSALGRQIHAMRDDRPHPQDSCIRLNSADWAFERMAWVSTLASCVVLICGGVICRHLGQPVGVAMLAMSPLLLGLGRRALPDMSALALQVGAMAVACAGPQWGVAVFLISIAAVCWKESGLIAQPAVWCFAGWLWGDWWMAAFYLGSVGLGWFAVMAWLLGESPLVFLRRVRKLNQPDWYNQNMIHGGPHRLWTDLTLVSPMALGAALVYGHLHPMWWMMALALGCYGWCAPVGIRISMILDVMVRIIAALTAPWWIIPICVAADWGIWYRVWWMGDLYDPCTSWLLKHLRMGP
jgi:hypothetical protein